MKEDDRVDGIVGVPCLGQYDEVMYVVKEIRFQAC
jgi:hypothetical protein